MTTTQHVYIRLVYCYECKIMHEDRPKRICWELSRKSPPLAAVGGNKEKP